MQKNLYIIFGTLAVIIIALASYMAGAKQVTHAPTVDRNTTPVVDEMTTASVITPTNQPSVKPTATPSETATWATFQNSSLQYKYPKNWIRDPDTSAGSQNYYLRADYIPGPGYIFSVLSFQANELTLHIQASDPVGTKKEIGQDIFETKIKNLSGLKGFITKQELGPNSATDSGPALSAYIFRDSNTIVLLEIKGNGDAELKTLEQIVSTFSFK